MDKTVNSKVHLKESIFGGKKNLESNKHRGISPSGAVLYILHGRRVCGTRNRQLTPENMAGGWRA